MNSSNSLSLKGGWEAPFLIFPTVGLALLRSKPSCTSSPGDGHPTIYPATLPNCWLVNLPQQWRRMQESMEKVEQLCRSTCTRSVSPHPGVPLIEAEGHCWRWGTCARTSSAVPLAQISSWGTCASPLCLRPPVRAVPLPVLHLCLPHPGSPAPNHPHVYFLWIVTRIAWYFCNHNAIWRGPFLVLYILYAQGKNFYMFVHYWHPHRELVTVIRYDCSAKSHGTSFKWIRQNPMSS